MARILSLLPVLLLSSAVSAQVSSSMATKGAFGVFANKKVHAVKDATPIKSFLRLSASDMRGRVTLARASSYVSHRSSSMARGAYAHMSDSAYALGGNKAGSSKPHSVALTLRAKTIVRGTIRLSYSGKKSGAGSAGASVVFGSTKWFVRADGKRHTLDVKGVLVGPKVLSILMSSNAMANASTTRSPAAAGGSLSLSFIPDRPAGFKVSISMGKASCPEGGKFSGTVRNTGRSALIAFKLQGSLKQAFGFLVLSPAASFFPLPGSKCIFFKAPIVVGMTKTDARGNAAIGMRIDAHQVKTSVKVPVQMVTAGLVKGGLRIVTSNSLSINITK